MCHQELCFNSLRLFFIVLIKKPTETAKYCCFKSVERNSYSYDFLLCLLNLEIS